MVSGAALCGRMAGVLGICVSISLAAPAAAQTSASFQVSATIVPGCEINGSPPTAGQNIGQMGSLDFGEHSALETGAVSASLTQNAGLALRCTPSVTLTMTLGAGLHAENSRNLQAPGGGRIAYDLYNDPGFTQQLGVDQPVPISFAGPDVITLPIYGRLALAPGNPPGTYTDTVIVTLAW